MDSWSNLTFRRNVSKICLKLVENIKHLSRKKTEVKQLYFDLGYTRFSQKCKTWAESSILYYKYAIPLRNSMPKTFRGT